MRRKIVGILVGLMLVMTTLIPVVITAISDKKLDISLIYQDDVLDIDAQAKSGGIEISFSNTGTSNITNLSWEMTLEKALILKSGNLDGSIESISPGETVNANTDPIIGFSLPILAYLSGNGNGEITVSAEYEETTIVIVVVVVVIIIIVVVIVIIIIIE